jgi:hypothetical protein
MAMVEWIRKGKRPNIMTKSQEGNGIIGYKKEGRILKGRGEDF